MSRQYTVQKGDSLWKISKDYGVPIDTLIRLNPNAGKIIHPNDVLKLDPDYTIDKINIRDRWIREQEFNKDNLSAIQNADHDGNYIVVDKLNRNLTIYDRNNNPLYTTNKIATGASGDDYNTITYVDKNGKVINKKGNNSTPAGITTISGIGTYHGYPAFTRARTDNKGNQEDIASSFHWGNIGVQRNVSNGCVRIEGRTLEDMSKFIGAGTKVYTLPEKEGSRFTLKGGNLNFTADNPYGIDKGSKRFWDDYNVNIDKNYQPLRLEWKTSGNKDYDNNVQNFANTIVDSKQKLQKQFGLSSDEYNRLAELALGIAQQETKFGTSTSYKGKKGTRDYLGNTITDYIINPIGRAARQLLNGKMPKNIFSKSSRGFTQLKLEGDNKGMQKVYQKLGITTDNIDNANNSALATLARLAYMYNTEVKGRNFIGANNQVVDPYYALLYKWNGHNEQLINHTATPDKNNYINNVLGYAGNFNMFENRKREKFKKGGKVGSKQNPIYLDEVLVTPDDKYNVFLNSLPYNQRYGNDDYNTYRFWQLNSKPIDFNEAVNLGMYELNDDGYYHAPTVQYNSATGEYEFMKSSKHATLQKELDWYFGNAKDAKQFRDNYDLNTNGEYYKYVPKNIHSSPLMNQMRTLGDYDLPSPLKSRKNSKLYRYGGQQTFAPVSTYVNRIMNNIKNAMKYVPTTVGATPFVYNLKQPKKQNK